MDEPISRVPFSVAEEHTIASMARWMRFMAVVGIVGAILMLLVLVVAVGLFSGLQHFDQTSPGIGPLQRAIEDAGGWIYLVGAVFFAAVAVTLWQNFTLYHAGDDFHLVAATDTADVDYLARGLDRLRTFFKVQVLMVLITIALAFGIAIVVFALWRRG